MAIVAAPIANSKLSQEVLDLRAKLSTSDTNVRLDAAADAAGLPKYTELPRPGLVASWGINEWIDWGSSRGFKRGEDTTRSHIMEHATVPGLKLSYSKAGGDVRSMMNTCADFRKSCMSCYHGMAALLVQVIDLAISGDHDSAQILANPAIIREFLRQGAANGNVARAVIPKFASNADNAAMAAIPGALRTLEKEFSISARAAFTNMGYAEVADSLALLFKQNGLIQKTLPNAALILLDLRAYVETNRAIIKKEMEDKQAARRAERELKEARREPGSKEKYEAAVVKTRGQIVTHYATVKTIAENMALQTQRVMEILKALPFPEFPGSPVEILEQRDAALSAYDSISMERDVLRSRVTEDAATINRLENDLIAAQKKAEAPAGLQLSAEHHKMLVELVVAINTKFKNLDLATIMATIKEVRARAAEVHATVLTPLESKA